MLTGDENECSSEKGRQGGARVKDMVECVISILRPLHYPVNK